MWFKESKRNFARSNGEINERGFRKSHPRLVKYATTEIRVITILLPFVSCACTIFTMQSGAVISRYNAKSYYDVIMSEMASQITSVSVVCPTVCWGAHHTHKIKISASLAFVGGNSPVTGGFPPPKKKKKKNAGNDENASIRRRHHDTTLQSLMLNINKNLSTQNPSNTTPQWASYGVVLRKSTAL